MDIQIRDQILDYLDNHPLMMALKDFKFMTDCPEISEVLKTHFQNYQTYDKFQSQVKNNFYNNLDELINEVFQYLRVIPNFFPQTNMETSNLSKNTFAFVCCINEVIDGLTRFVRLVRLDKTVLNAKYISYLSRKVDKMVNERPNSFESSLLYENRTRIFGSHSIPEKLNPM